MRQCLNEQENQAEEEKEMIIHSHLTEIAEKTKIDRILIIIFNNYSTLNQNRQTNTNFNNYEVNRTKL